MRVIKLMKIRTKVEKFFESSTHPYSEKFFFAFVCRFRRLIARSRLQRRNLGLIGLIGLMAGCFALVSCTDEPPVPICSSQSIQALKQAITGDGGQYVTMGDQTYITIPSNVLFRGNSSNMTAHGKSVITHLAKVLTCKHNWASQVTVYNDAFSSRRASVALARQQGNVILSRLWQYGRMSVAASKGVIARCGCGKRLNAVEIVTDH